MATGCRRAFGGRGRRRPASKSLKSLQKPIKAMGFFAPATAFGAANAGRSSAGMTRFDDE
jgi:hypothetical protein